MKILKIKCERLHLKRLVAAGIAFLMYLFFECKSYSADLKYTEPIICLFVLLVVLSYFAPFNEEVCICRDERYITVLKGNNEKRYEHKQQDEIKLFERSILANYDELVIFLPNNRKLSFVLSVYERSIDSKLMDWKE